MERFAMKQLEEWYIRKNRKPLILKGARQVGKTWLMKEFGRTHFKYTAYVNFDNNRNMANGFEGDYDIDRILMAINIETGVKIHPEETLIIFDEIQENPKAKSLRVYCEKFKPQTAIRTSMSNYREQDWMVNVPLFAVSKYLDRQ